MMAASSSASGAGAGAGAAATTAAASSSASSSGAATTTCSTCGGASVVEQEKAKSNEKDRGVVGSRSSAALASGGGGGAVVPSKASLSLSASTPTMMTVTTMMNSREFQLEVNRLVYMCAPLGCQLLVNAPMTLPTSEEGGVNVWTLPLSVTIQQGDEKSFECLAKRGAAVDVWDHLCKSPLVRAVECNLIGLARRLVELGASPTPHDLAGHSALRAAIERGNVELVEELLKSGAAVNTVCPAIPRYRSPLFVACGEGHAEIAKLLLRSKADPFFAMGNNIKCNPTTLAYKKSPSLLPELLDSPLACVPSSGSAGPLVGAAASSSSSSSSRSQKMERRKRQTVKEIMTLAVAANDVPIVEMLVDKYPRDALTTVQPRNNNSPVAAAIKKPYSPISQVSE
eukprot:GHVU01110590.1.p1 GENE.GHVU01110590.1~~GHVU01110590.1.p1  ORF type:complete len:408 (+),score=104.91 GHVU01110590.1:30-1226(+)